MRKLKALPMTLLMVVGSTQSFAEVMPRRGNMPGVAYGVVQQSPGEYSFREYDQTRLESEMLSLLRQRSAEDAQFVQSKVAQINLAFKSLRDNHLVAKPSGINLASLLNTYGEGRGTALAVSDKEEDQKNLGEALNAVRKFKADMADLKNIIASVAMIPSALNPTEEVRIEGSQVRVRGQLEVNFGALQEFYSNQISELESEISRQKIMVMQNFGAPVLQDILNIRLGNTYTLEQLRDMTTRAERLMLIGTEDRNRLRQVHLFTFNQFRNIIRVFGKEERYRSNLNPTQREEVVRDFKKLMWSRSLLRASTGIPGFLGTIGIDHRKLAFNLDILGSIELSMRVEPVIHQDELVIVRDAIVNKLFSLETSTRDPLALATYRSAFTSMTGAVSAINSLGTFLSGRMQQAEVTKIILKEIAYDAHEEYLLATGNFAEMRRLYQARWYSGLSSEEIAQVRADAQSLMSQSQTQASGLQALNQRASTDNLVGIMVIARNTLKNYTAAYEQAQQILAIRNAATADSKTDAAVQQNLNDL